MAERIDTSWLITLGSIVLNLGSPDSDGNRWWGELLGWGPPAPRPLVSPLVLADGEFFSGSTFGPREVTMRGFVRGLNLTGLTGARMKLARQVSLMTDALATLSVSESGSSLTTTASVHLAEQPQFEVVACMPHESVAVGRWQLGLRAPDPRRYSSVLNNTIITSTPTNLLNIGSWRALPVLTVIGTTGSPITVTNGTRSVIFNISLGVSIPLVADFAKRTVTVAGVDRADVVSPASDWWWMEPNSAANNVSITGGGTASLAWRAVYL